MSFIAGQVVNDQILVDVWVFNPEDESKQQIKGLIDTGAQCSAVSGQLADSLGLGLAGLEPYRPQNHIPMFSARFAIEFPAPAGQPPDLRSRGVMALRRQELNQWPFDALVGMDFLEGYCLLVVNGEYILSIK